MCPKCNQPLRRVTANSGSFFMTCPNRVPARVQVQLRPGEKRSDHCGQTVHLVAVEGVALVTPISKAQFEIFRRSYPAAAEVYRQLGILPSRPLDTPKAIPEYPCSDCGTLTKLHDLYGGLCRTCKPQQAAQQVEA